MRQRLLQTQSWPAGIVACDSLQELMGKRMLHFFSAPLRLELAWIVGSR